MDKRLEKAIKEKALEDLRALIRDGVDLEEPISDYPNALHLAVAYNNSSVIEILLESGANVNVVDKNGRTPLSRVTVGNSYKASQLVLARAKGLDLNAPQTKDALNAAMGRAADNLGSRRVYNILNQRMLEHDGPWFKVDDQTIKHIKFDWDSMIEVSEVFNFKAARQTTMVRDFENSMTNVEHCYFADIPENGIQFVKEALEELKVRDGGEGVDERILSQGFRYMKRRR